MTRWLRGALGVGMGVGLTLLCAEVGVRAVGLQPVRQLLRFGAPDLVLEDVEGVPWWTVDRPRRAMAGRCASDTAWDIGFAGDSIFTVAVGGNPATDPFPTRLGAAWEARPSGPCAVHVSEAGFGPEQVLIALERAHARRPLEAVVVGVFKGTGQWTRAGDWFISTSGMATTETGMPSVGVPVPDGVHRWAFEHSALWRLSALAWAVHQAPSTPGSVADQASGYLRIAAWAASHDLPVLWTVWPGLDRPFEASGVGTFPAAVWTEALADQARAAGWAAPSVLWVAEALHDVDVTAVRGDLCCHYTPEGHAVVLSKIQADIEAFAAEATRPE